MIKHLNICKHRANIDIVICGKLGVIPFYEYEYKASCNSFIFDQVLNEPQVAWDP